MKLRPAETDLIKDAPLKFSHMLVVALIGTLLAAFSSAQAAVQTYAFSGTLDSGFYLGQGFSGNFSFDDLALAGSGAEFLGVDSLTLSILGRTYTQADADAPAEAGYSDGSFLGLSYSVSSSEPQFSLIFGSLDTSDAYIAYDATLSLIGSGAGNVIYTPVPEPRDGLTLLAGLGLVGVMVERVKRRRV
jgi:hypothetical protein